MPSYDFADNMLDMSGKERKQQTLMEICDFLSGAPLLTLGTILHPTEPPHPAVPAKPSPLANETVVATLIEMVSLNLFKQPVTVTAEPSEDEEVALDPSYAHTQAINQFLHPIISINESIN